MHVKTENSRSSYFLVEKKNEEGKNMMCVDEGELPEISQGFEKVWLVLMLFGSAGWREGGRQQTAATGQILASETHHDGKTEEE